MERDTPKHVGENWYRYVINKSVHLVGVIEETSNKYTKMHGMEHFNLTAVTSLLGVTLR
jgi:hypothetical protein